MRVEWFVGSNGMSYCRVYDVICDSMVYRDVWGHGKCIT